LGTDLSASPTRNNIVDEGIVHPLPDLMAQSVNVLNWHIKYAGVAVGRNRNCQLIRCLPISCVEAQDAAIVDVEILVEKWVVKDERGQSVRREFVREEKSQNERKRFYRHKADFSVIYGSTSDARAPNCLA